MRMRAGEGPLPGRAQPEVRHCSVTWYPPAHHDGWGATRELPKYHPCKSQAPIFRLSTAVPCCFPDLAVFITAQAHCRSGEPGSWGMRSIVHAHAHTHSRSVSGLPPGCLFGHAALSGSTKQTPSTKHQAPSTKHPASSWCMILSPSRPGRPAHACTCRLAWSGWACPMWCWCGWRGAGAR